MAISLHELFNRQNEVGDIRSFRDFLSNLVPRLVPRGSTVSVRELHRRLPFPENAVDVMPVYITPALLDQLPSVTEAFNVAGVITNDPYVHHEVNTNRKALRAFLNDPQFKNNFLEKYPSGRCLLHELYFTMQTRQRFHSARTLLDELLPIGGSAFAAAWEDPEGAPVTPFWTSNIRVTAFGNPSHPQYTVHILGYGGPNLTWDEKLQLDAVRAFTLATSPEHRFRLGLLRGDIHVGLREFAAAIEEYDNTRHALDPVPLTRGRRKFLAIRSGFAHLARGDQLYRSTRDLSSNAITEAIAHYRAAVQVVHDQEVSEENYFHQAIKDSADKRMTQLSNSLNFLGYSNAYIPAGPSFGGSGLPDSMFGLAMQRVSAAQRVRSAFVAYLQAAEDAHRANAEAANAVREAEASITSAQERQTTAGLRRDAASARLESVKSKNGLLNLTTFRDYVVAAAETTAAAAAAGSGAGIVLAAGIASHAVKKWAALEELDVEEKLAEFDLHIAESEVRSAALEVLMAESRKRFLDEQKKFLTDGAELNQEVYYALAREYERLTEAHMEGAIKYAFFAERRAAFERGAPILSPVRLEYLTPVADDLGHVGGLLIAPDDLESDLNALNEAFQRAGQDVTEHDLRISLLSDYPIEFSAFKQSGRLSFKISLYDLERFKPGYSDQRIKDLRITLDGLATPRVNLNGVLRHSGTFIVRDRASAENAERLLPTPEELDAALAMFQQGRTSTITTKGITFWQVDPHEKSLTTLQDDPDIEEFRDYGFTGVWELEILPSENPGLDLHQINDIIIEINGRANQGTSTFRAHIRELVKQYEKEQQPAGQDEARDRTTALSMRSTELFRDAFDDFLVTGAMTFQIQAATFPDNQIRNAQVKTVLFQAINNEGKGVEGVQLRVSKEGTAVTFDRTTLADGFSENLNTDLPVLEPVRRFALEGRWHCDAADPTRLARVNDLIMFFIYAVPEEEG
jgi:hypothetical protein